jgi:hypothetical protein
MIPEAEEDTIQGEAADLTGVLTMSDDWLRPLIEDVCRCLISDVKGRMSPLSHRTYAPDENAIGTWLIHVAPANGQVVGGKDDGEEIFDPIDADLLELGKVLDDTESFVFNPGGHTEKPHFWLSGRKHEEEVTIQIFLYPFDEEDPSWSIDINQGTWKMPGDDPEGDDGE